MSAEPTITVLNTPCLLTTREALADRLGERCRQPRAAESPLSVDFTNVHIVALRTTDDAFLETTSSVDWFVSDSQILSWAIRLLGGRNHARVYGPDFLNYFFGSGPKGLSHYFLGGSEECLERLCRNLDALEPGFLLAGRRHGYFGADDEAGILEEINRLNPDVLWVGLGTPKQQDWIARNKSKLKAGAVLAVGFAFDVNAGTKKDAPAWLGPIGCTWLYRLLCEPRRLWRRYLIYNTVFLYRLMLQCGGRRA
jgi:N-acetylglucosaminyldiphosphoundecaprenol N-acetyl-beta-D-mannosaminyltransferase